MRSVGSRRSTGEGGGGGGGQGGAAKLLGSPFMTPSMDCYRLGWQYPNSNNHAPSTGGFWDLDLGLRLAV